MVIDDKGGENRQRYEMVFENGQRYEIVFEYEIMRKLVWTCTKRERARLKN